MSSFKTQYLSPLAQFYQAVTVQGSSPIELFEMLAQEDKNMIFERVYINAGKPSTSDYQWGEHHALDDLNLLAKSLSDVILIKFD